MPVLYVYNSIYIIYIQVIRGAELDSIDFRSQDSQAYFKHDNTCIMCHWNETVSRMGKKNKKKKVVKKRLAFGIIQKLYWHTLWPGLEQPKVIAECKWYQYHGINPRSQLVQIKSWPLWDKDCSVTFLENCVSQSCQFWPSNPFANDETQRMEYLDVCLHHELMPKFDID